MAKFRFSLEPVLEQRQREEDAAQRQLAQVLREQMIIQTQIRTMQQDISTSRQSLGQSLVGAVDMDAAMQFARFSLQMRGRAQSMVMRLAELERKIADARGALLEARKRRRAIELLRDKQQAAHKQREDRREAAVLDDTATSQYLRQGEEEAKRRAQAAARNADERRRSASAGRGYDRDVEAA